MKINDIIIIVVGATAVIGASIYLTQKTIDVNNQSTGSNQSNVSNKSVKASSSITPTGHFKSGTTISEANYPNQNPVTIVTTTTPTGSNSANVSSVAITGPYIIVNPTTINKTPNTGQIITIKGYNFKPNEKAVISANYIGIHMATANNEGKWSESVENIETKTNISGLWNAIQDNQGSVMKIGAYGYGGSGYSNKVSVTLVQ